MHLHKNRSLGAVVVLLAISCTAATANAAMLLGNFDPAPIGTGLVGISYDSASGHLFLYKSFETVIREYTTAGVEVNTIARPGGSSNDFDLESAPEQIDFGGGTTVSANTLLVTNGDDSPETLYALDKSNGSTLATRELPSAGSVVGGAYHADRNTFFTIDFVGSDTIREIDLSTGNVVNSFAAQPAGSPAFDVAFGDIEVSQTTGNLLLVSDKQQAIRVLTPTGGFVQDIDVSGAGLGISGPGVVDMTGIALNDATGEAWISSLNGMVYHLDGVLVVPLPATVWMAMPLISSLGVLQSIRRRRPAS